MNRQTPEPIRQWAFDTIAEVPDEVGSERMGDYVLLYEGWSAFCLDDVLESLPPDADVEKELFDAAPDPVFIHRLQRFPSGRVKRYCKRTDTASEAILRAAGGPSLLSAMA